YVTHDQTEALTFADLVVVMNNGEVVQVGTPIELFDRPAHTFVGHFIGSPGMNVLPASLENGGVSFMGSRIEVIEPQRAGAAAGGQVEIGIRPEFISFGSTGLPVEIGKVSDAGRFRIVEARHQGQLIRVLVPEGYAIPADGVHLAF